MSATKAQVAALRWLIERGSTEKIDSTALWTMYRDTSDLRPHALRVVAWKRSSGRLMAALRDAGLLSLDALTYSTSGGRVYYAITDAGRKAAS